MASPIFKGRSIVNGHPNSDIDQLLPSAYRRQEIKAVAYFRGHARLVLHERGTLSRSSEVLKPINYMLSAGATSPASWTMTGFA
ncbi:hypothetical protein J2R96_002045 [Bradyrhizobium elkanii]|nr:hypothetical protein [Bradyrhizobium elkanii]